MKEEEEEGRRGGGGGGIYLSHLRAGDGYIHLISAIKMSGWHSRHSEQWSSYRRRAPVYDADMIPSILRVEGPVFWSVGV